MTRRFHARIARTSAHMALALVAVACGRKDEPPPAENLPHVGTSAPGASSGSTATPAPEPLRAREPDWYLDPKDPAKDYVERYLRASKRFGDQASCVVVAPSTFAEGRSIVEAKNDGTGKCGPAGAVRDRFFVSVATDRMSLDPSMHTNKLAPWPDGSDPDGPPNKVGEPDIRGLAKPLKDAFQKLELAPLRIQLYGRGTYPVISIAGWHGGVLRSMGPGELARPAKALCIANGGEPMGVFAGFDRATLLRVTCPGSGAFESLL